MNVSIPNPNPIDVGSANKCAGIKRKIMFAINKGLMMGWFENQ